MKNFMFLPITFMLPIFYLKMKAFKSLYLAGKSVIMMAASLAQRRMTLSVTFGWILEF